MTQRWLQFVTITTATALVPALLLARRYGPPPGRTGAPGEGTCVACHTTATGVFIPNSSALSIDFGGGSAYTPGGPKQRWTVKVDDPAGVVFGFELSARVEGTNAQAGHFNAIAGGDHVIVVPLAFFEYVEHTQPNTTGSFTFEWTPPATDAGNIKVYLAANAANGSGSSTGDRIHTASFTLSPAVSPARPVITPGQVANIWSGQPLISDAGWIYIKGTSLSQTTRVWRPEEIVGGQLPKSLDGVSVKVNNQDAYVYYISPGQINVQVPSGPATGPVPVEVTSPTGTSDPVMVNRQQIAPALLVWPLSVATEPDRYVGAVSTDGVLLGKTGLLRPVGLRTRPPKPGDVVSLFATGCGPTNPPTSAGQVIGTPAPVLASPVTLRVGGQPAANAGYLISAGVCQFNATLPANLPDGDHLVELEIGGNPAQRNVLITVQK